MADSFYAPNQVHDWQSKLTSLAQKPRTRFTKKQAVEAMIEEVELALVSHPYEEVAENLKQWGLNITAGTLKQYVNAYRREHTAEKAAPARKRSSQNGKQKKTNASAASTGEKEKGKATGGRSHSTSRKATKSDDDNWTADFNQSSKANRKPKNFIDMPEEL